MFPNKKDKSSNLGSWFGGPKIMDFQGYMGIPPELLKRSVKKLEVGGEVCFVSRLADKMYQVT